MKRQLIHTHHDAVELRYAGRTLFRYVYEPDMPQMESPKPYFHPLYTLAGNEVTLYRPHDHVWHTGLSMTCAQLSDQNFWGGPTYVRDEGYVALRNNGSIRHAQWSGMHCDDGGVDLCEELRWITLDGETWLHERRRIAVSEIDPQQGYWALDLQFNLVNVRGTPLVFGSPTTQGRPLAGYGGLFWRGPRSFLGGSVLAAGGLDGPGIMGQRASWLAYVGAHDGNAQQSTLVFLDRPGNPSYPNKWFIRNDPYPAVSLSFMFDEEYALAPDDELILTYRVLIADGAWPRERIEALADRHPMAG